MGYGTVSKTLAESQIGIAAHNMWLCEEHAFFNLPVIYSAYAYSPIVRVLRIHKVDLQSNVQEYLLTQMSAAIWLKLEMLRDRLSKTNEVKQEVMKMDIKAAVLPGTIDHINKMYPNFNMTLKRKVRTNTLELTGNNPLLVMFTDNKRNEEIRNELAERRAHERGEEYVNLKDKIFEKNKVRTYLKYGVPHSMQSYVD